MKHTFCIIGLLGASLAHAQVSVDDMREAMRTNPNAVVIDIRESAEHARGVAAGMRLLPMSQLGSRLVEVPQDQAVLLICNTQNRSKAVTAELQKRGWKNIQYVNGGMKEWAERKLPMVAPTATPGYPKL